jgi:hypothetical protein
LSELDQNDPELFLKQFEGEKNFQCHQEGERILGNNIPIAFLQEFLLNV